MQISGYNAAFRSKIIVEGLRGHMKKVVPSLERYVPMGESIRDDKAKRKDMAVTGLKK